MKGIIRLQLSHISGGHHQNHFLQRLQAENHVSRLWFRGYLGETRGLFHDQWNGKTHLNPKIFQEEIIIQKQELPVPNEDLLILDVESEVAHLHR